MVLFPGLAAWPIVFRVEKTGTVQSVNNLPSALRVPDGGMRAGRGGT